jgi:glycosyltransferase involved in cell wall biosynthesis
MKIAVNTRFLLPGQLEGFGWYTHEIVRRMVLNHPDDEFLFLFDRPFDPRFVYADNVTPVVVFPPARHPVLFYTWFEWAIPKVMKRFGAQVFFSPDSMCSLRSDIPVVMTTHDIVPLHFPEQISFVVRKYLLAMLPRFLKRANQVITVSDYVKQDIVQTCGLDLNKISVVYNGCRDGFKPLNDGEKQSTRDQFSNGQPFFFYTGAIHPRKNIHRLIRAFDAFKARTGAPVQLLLAGRFAWQTGEVKTAWDQSNYQTDIRFLGYVSEEDLTRLMASALALTYVSLSEGFGLPMLEAMYSDTPVMASSTTCLPEVAGDAALLVDPYSETALAAGLEQLYSDPGLRQNLVEKGRIRRTAFSWDGAAEQIYRILQSVAKT